MLTTVIASGCYSADMLATFPSVASKMRSLYFITSLKTTQRGVLFIVGIGHIVMS